MGTPTNRDTHEAELKKLTNGFEPQTHVAFKNGDQGIGNGDMENDDYDEHTDKLCGYGSCTPMFLQRLHNSRMLLFVLSLCFIIHGFIVNGLVPVSITTLEKRFNLSSTQSGLFAIFYDFSVILVMLPVAYLGDNRHKGRWCGWGMLMVGCGSLLCVLPQFLSGPYQTDDNLSLLCSDTNSSEVCTSGSSSISRYFWILLAGQFLHGIGGAPLLTLAVTYIDENVTQHASPMYLGIFYASSTLGPAIGYMLGGALLRIYGDVGKVDQHSLGLQGPEDPRWYGAWWLGFVISGMAAILISIPVMCFARELPEAEKHRSKDVNQTNQHPASMRLNSAQLTDKLTHMPMHCFHLFCNPTYTCMVVMCCATAFFMNGMINFLPKIVENFFHMSASEASLITGGILVPFGLAGNLFGGYIHKKANLNCAKAILVTFLCELVCLALLFLFFIRCPEVPLTGVNDAYLVDESAPFVVNVTHSCNAACGCTNYYNPVCSPGTGNTYYSPCHAGCALENYVAGKKEWGQCSCVPVGADGDGTPLVEGLCKIGCNKLKLWLLLAAFLIFFTFATVVPVQQSILRCVKFSQRSLAMGLKSVCFRMFGSIPGGIFFGLAIDKTCSLWKEACGEKLSCLRYDGAGLTVVVVGFGTCLKLICLAALFLAWKFYKAPVPQKQQDLNNTDDVHVNVNL